MPSIMLRTQLDHYEAVRNLLVAAGHPVAPGAMGALTDEELYLHTLAVTAGVTPREFVYQILAKRGKVAAA